MAFTTGFSSLAAALADPTRARVLSALMEGRALTATELCGLTDVMPSTMSAHLKQLEGLRLVERAKQGRYSYFRIANPDVAHAIESLSAVADPGGLSFQPSTPVPLRRARSCYDHAAGEFAVDLLDRILKRKWLVATVDGFAVTGQAESRFGELDIDVGALRALRRRFAHPCLDWSERRYHLAGALGAALLDTLIRRRWVARELDSRRLIVSERGRDGLARWAG